MKQIIFICGVLLCNVAFTQTIRTTDKSFEKRIDLLLSETVPFKYVAELSEADLENYLLLDARELEEYETSHIKGAKYIGYDKPDYTVLSDVEDDQPIILYCSIGYRSEKIGEQLKERGFTEVYNLYGSIFEWVNQDKPIVDESGEETKKIYTYSWMWSKWMMNSEYQQIW